MFADWHYSKNNEETGHKFVQSAFCILRTAVAHRHVMAQSFRDYAIHILGLVQLKSLLTSLIPEVAPVVIDYASCLERITLVMTVVCELPIALNQVITRGVRVARLLFQG